MGQIGDRRSKPSRATTGAALTSASPGILTGGRKETADARGEATSGLATIKEREVGALFFLEVRHGNDERGVDVIPMGTWQAQGRESNGVAAVLASLGWVHWFDSPMRHSRTPLTSHDCSPVRTKISISHKSDNIHEINVLKSVGTAYHHQKLGTRKSPRPPQDCRCCVCKSVSAESATLQGIARTLS
jgi:hypothetical protein